MRNGLALQLTVRLLDKIVSGQLPVDRVLLIEANDNAKKDSIRKDLKAQLPVVRCDIALVPRCCQWIIGWGETP